MLKNTIKRIIILTILVFGSACTPLYKTCLFGGCYGPLEIVIKTESGEHVEDIIVSISHITADHFEGTARTYSEQVIGNTDEVIRFPRGYMYNSDADMLSLNFQIYHPDYQASDLYVSIPNKSGVIDLGVKKIASSKSATPSVAPNYFSYLISLEREDLVEKYLPDKIKTLAAYKGYNENQAIEFEEKFRKKIRQKASQL